MKNGSKLRVAALVVATVGIGAMFQNCGGYRAGAGSSPSTGAAAGTIESNGQSYRVLSMASTTETPELPPGNVRVQSYLGFIDGIDADGFLNGWSCSYQYRRLGYGRYDQYTQVAWLNFLVDGQPSSDLQNEWNAARFDRSTVTESAIHDLCGSNVVQARFRARLPSSLRREHAGQSIVVQFADTGGNVEQGQALTIPGVGQAVSAAVPPPPPPPPPSPPPSSAGHEVTGYVDGVQVVDGFLRISGWACMKSDDAPIDVHLYVGGAAGAGGEFIASVRADRSSEQAIAQACGIGSLNHRYEFNLDPATAARTASRGIFVHGISTYGNPNLTLVNSGLYMVAAIPSIIDQLSYSSAGPIAGRACVQLLEPSDPHTWSDNYLCSPRDLGLRWSYAGPIAGMTCTQINEPSDPDTWDDNYLCSPTNLGLQWSFAGPIAGRRCVQIHEAADPHAWSDNYLCGP